MELDLDQLADLWVQNLQNYSASNPRIQYNEARGVMEKLEESEKWE